MHTAYRCVMNVCLSDRLCVCLRFLQHHKNMYELRRKQASEARCGPNITHCG